MSATTTATMEDIATWEETLESELSDLRYAIRQEAERKNITTRDLTWLLYVESEDNPATTVIHEALSRMFTATDAAEFYLREIGVEVSWESRKSALNILVVATRAMSDRFANLEIPYAED